MKALGLLVRLLARPDNWKTNSECLSREFGVGRDQIRNVLNELEEFGYMQLVKSQNELGHWNSVWYIFDDANEVVPKPENQGLGKPGSGDSGPITRTDLPRTDNKLFVLSNTVNTVTKNGKFELFWIAYPRKTNKSFAQKVFKKITFTDELFITMMQALKNFPFAKDPQYIPHPSTWLNGRRWEDELPQKELTDYEKAIGRSS